MINQYALNSESFHMVSQWRGDAEEIRNKNLPASYFASAFEGFPLNRGDIQLLVFYRYGMKLMLSIDIHCLLRGKRRLIR